jgi:type II secretory pathway pseudopilin PulG
MTGGVIAVMIVLIIAGGFTAAVVSYFRLQQHRSDAVAMASYRRLAEQAVENQVTLNARLDEMETRLKAMDDLLRSVG